MSSGFFTDETPFGGFRSGFGAAKTAGLRGRFPETSARRRSRVDTDTILKRVLAVIAIVLGAELLWFFGVRPCMPLSNFEVKGVPGTDTSAVLAAAGIGGSSSFMTVNREAAEAALSALPMVQSARVIKHFPSGIEIILEPRNAAALTLLASGGKLRPALIGGNGVILDVGSGLVSGEQGDSDLPLVSGLPLENAGPGMKIPRMYGGFFMRLETLARESPQLLATVSEIKINHKNYDGFDLTLYPAHVPIRVRTGAELSAETLRYMLVMLDVLSPRADEIEEIDFRTGTASYVLKEAYSG
jgi:cell division protein FtsQ